MDELLSIQTLRVRQGNSLLGDFAVIIAKWMGSPFTQWNTNVRRGFQEPWGLCNRIRLDLTRHLKEGTQNAPAT